MLVILILNQHKIEGNQIFVVATFLSSWHNVQETVNLMDVLYLLFIQTNQSFYLPTQTISFVGFVWKSISMTFCITSEKANEFAWVTCKIVACQRGVFHAPPICFKNQ